MNHLVAVGAALTAIIIGLLLAFTTKITWSGDVILGVLFILAGAVWLVDHAGGAYGTYRRR